MVKAMAQLEVVGEAKPGETMGPNSLVDQKPDKPLETLSVHLDPGQQAFEETTASFQHHHGLLQTSTIDQPLPYSAHVPPTSD